MEGIIARCNDQLSVWGETWKATSTGAGCKFVMEDVAGGRLLPEVSFSTSSCTCEEAAIRGEGHRPGLLDIHGIQEFRMLSIPHKDSRAEEKGESRVGGKEEKSV